jgi:hypothetical protein
MKTGKIAYYLFLAVAVAVSWVMLEMVKDAARALSTETQYLSAHSRQPAPQRACSAPKPKAQKEQLEIDWTWLRPGARMFNEDGSPIAGGPYIAKERKMPTKAAPRGVSKYAPAETARRRDALFDEAFQLSDDVGREL